MDGPKHISFVIRHLYHIMDRNFGSGCSHSNGTTAYHGRIIGYLYAHRDTDVFQRDIENHFGIRRSTVTKVLQAMESNGLITRTAVLADARLKKITLTEKASDMHEHFRKEIDSFELMLSEGLSEEEKESFFHITEKIYNNLIEKERNDSRKC